ncbi:MAG: autotransporter outer rane beta-barrel protein [Chthoniobacteraceae bacterium]|nr:autotransporter outer rane beta-barrel protein [Chthoniobacteraceae bacterium]
MHKICRRVLRGTVAALLFSGVPLRAQFTTPHVIATPGEVSATLGETTFINHGLQGVGRISGSALDIFGETFGSVSSLQVTNWTSNASGSYTGTFNILPDRGYNNNNAGGFFSDYAARIQQMDFSFTPYTGSASIGGSDLGSRIAAQNQITITSPITGVKFTYADPNTGNGFAFTSGLDPAAGQSTLFGNSLPYVSNYTGQAFPGATANTTYADINKLALDAEALVLKADGSGYVGDEYGANIYYFNANKQIVGVITPPDALRPHKGTGSPLNFNSTTPPDNGRRNNQGFEGVALSPDGKRLFALLQSAAVQDTNGAAMGTRTNTRMLVYDVAGNALPDAPVAEYVIQLPTYTANGNGGAVNATAAQSEIIAIDDHRLLVLSRDANGQGSLMTNPSMYKSVLLVDLSVGTPTNIAGTAHDATGATVTASPGTLDSSITPLSWTEALNILNSAQLSKFNIDLDPGGTNQITKLTLGEKWEGMSLVSANDPLAPNDYFLFIANDNDFLTGTGKMVGPDGTIQSYDAWSNGYAANRVPTAATVAATTENDTMFLAYRVTVVPEPCSALLISGGAAGLLARRRRR